MAYVQRGHPYPVTSCGRRRTFMQGSKEDMLLMIVLKKARLIRKEEKEED